MPIDWQAIGVVATFLAVAVSLYLGLGIRKKIADYSVINRRPFWRI